MRSQNRRILFAKLGAFSHTNDMVARQLTARFPDHELVVVDVRDFFRRQPAALARSLLAEFGAYGPSVFRSRSEMLAFFFRSPSAFRHISTQIGRRFEGQEHTFDFVLQTQGLFNARLTGVPHLIYTDYTFLSNLEFAERDARVFRSRTFLDLETHLYLQADAVMVMADHVEQTLVNRYRCDPTRVDTVGVGANVETAPYETALQRYSAQRILFVGVEWERKGGPELVQAFRALRSRYPGATLDVVGCRPAISEPGVQVHGLMPRSAVARFLAQASIFSLPSRIEPLGIAAVEASLFALPVVVAAAGGLPETVAQGSTGFLVPPGDVAALTQALDRLLADPMLCRTMGEAGQRRNVDRFNWDAVGQRIEDMANRVANPELV